MTLKAARAEAERELLRQELERAEGNMNAVARLIGCSRHTLYRKLRQHRVWSLRKKMRKAA